MIVDKSRNASVICYLSGVGWSNIPTRVKDMNGFFLVSFAEFSKDKFNKVAAGLEQVLKSSGKLMIDSGAFSVDKQGGGIDIDSYLDLCVHFRDRVEFIALDVIGKPDKSFANYYYMWERGAKVIPVYHLGDDLQWLDRYLDMTDYVCFGAVGKKRISSGKGKDRDMGIDRRAFDKARNTIAGRGKTVKLHLLGISGMGWLKGSFDVHSVDNSTPVIIARSGRILFWREGLTRMSSLYCSKRLGKDRLFIDTLVRDRIEENALLVGVTVDQLLSDTWSRFKYNCFVYKQMMKSQGIDLIYD